MRDRRLATDDMTATDWSEWLRQCREMREQVYRADPDEVTANYDREVAHVRDYHGREVLELIQNADDAGRGYGTNSAKVVVRPFGLCIANTGVSFTPEGVKSLVLSDNSPKREERAQYIGNRGLGFRSVLNWTTCPFVLSGELRLAFDQDRSKAWFRRLSQEDPAVAARIEKRQSGGHPFPAAVLSVPLEIPEDGEGAERFVESPSFVSTLSLGLDLRKDGFDTVIGVPFTHEGAFDDVHTQLSHLSEEVMLFLNHLEQLEVDVPGAGHRWHVIKRASEEVVLSTADGEGCRWLVERRQGAVPASHLRRDQTDTPDYEVRVAVPEDGKTSGGFFNYLPSAVRFPFRVVAHATVELTNNRQSLANTSANRFISCELARALAAAAERRAKPDDPWRAVQMVAPTGDLDPLLESFDFSSALLGDLSTRRILPCRDGTMRSVESGVVRFPCDPGEWLPVSGFGDLVLWKSNKFIRRFLDQLEVPVLSSSELGERLTGISPTLSIRDRAVLVAGMQREGLIRTPVPPLLVDVDGELIDSERTVFLPPGEGERFELPNWMSLRVLHPKLMAELYTHLEIQRAEDLRSRLSAFQIRLYSLAALTSAIHAQVRERAEANPRDSRSIHVEGLRAMKQLFDSRGPRDRPVHPADLKVLIPARDGHLSRASSLYFGREYGQKGSLCELLYRFAGGEAFVAPPRDFGWEDDDPSVADFLSWLGVASSPRKEQTELRQNAHEAYFKWVGNRLSYPLNFRDKRVGGQAEFEKWVRARVEGATWFDRLDRILNHVDPHAILAWLAQDDRLEALRRDGDAPATLMAAPTGKHNPRKLRRQQVPSYAIWLIESTPWLPTGPDDGCGSPNECVLEPPGATQLQSLFPVPHFEPEHSALTDLGIDGRLRRLALERAGVRLNLNDFSWNECYELLLRLPDLDPSGDAAGRLYGMLLERPGKPEQHSRVVKRFQERGLLWAVLGSEAGYRRPEEVHYLASRMVPEAVRDALPLLPVSPTHSRPRAKARLSVTVVDPSSLNVVIEDHEELPQSDRFAAEVEELKYYIAAFRFSANSESRGLRQLPDLTVTLCKSVSGKAEVGERTIPINLTEEGTFVLEDDRAYMLYSRPLPDAALTNSTLAAGIAELFAVILNVQEQTTYELLAMHPPGERATVLSRLMGTDVEPVLREMRKRLPELKRPGKRLMRPAPPPPEPPPPMRPQMQSEEPAESEQQHDGTPPVPGPVPERVVAIEQVTTLRPKKSRTVRFRIKATSGSVLQPRSSSYWTVDASHGEAIAQRFEESQGRHVLPVAHVQGEETLHCDLLSFASDAEKARFQHSLDHGLIQRLIEVKSSAIEEGDVVMRENVATTAQEYADRFYLYRVYIGPNSEYKVVVLQNPMGYDWPRSYRVDLFAEDRAEVWDVRPDDPDGTSSGGEEKEPDPAADPGPQGVDVD